MIFGMQIKSIFGFCQGCQIFPGTTYQNVKNIPNNHKIYQMAKIYADILHSKYPPKFTRSAIFGLKNMPSGNPGFCHQLSDASQTLVQVHLPIRHQIKS
jgi:hypothetical protein